VELVNGRHIDKLCFTLTMWDVKIILIGELSTRETGFTLTMWDVKFG